MNKKEKKVNMKVIEPTKKPENHFKEPGERLRVAAYARVSSETDEQENSFENQMEYFKWLIEGNPHYIFAGLYADEGITGTSTKNRYGFQEMMEDARSGKIDLILVKSISRFGRNTLDTLNSCRELKSAGVDVFFEKENIHIMEQAGELLLTIFSSLAQEESRSISENVKMGIRSGYKRGSYRIHFSKYVGYDKDENGKLQINADAWIVRYIYLLFFEGHSFHNIAEILNSEGIKKPVDSETWARDNIAHIIHNEKYCGDVLLQKSYVKDYLEHKAVKNDGVLPQYYIYDDHEAIIPRELFYYTLNEYQKRKSKGDRPGAGSTRDLALRAKKITCTECHVHYGHKTGHSNDKYRFDFYRCNRCYQNHCHSTTVRDEALQKLYLDVLDELNGDDHLKIIDLLIASIDPEGLYKKALRRAEKIREHEHTIEVTPAEATEFLKSVKKKKERLETEHRKLIEKYTHAKGLVEKLTLVRERRLFRRKFETKNYSILLDEIQVNGYKLTFVFRDGSKFVRFYDPRLAKNIVVETNYKKKKKIRTIICQQCNKEFETTAESPVYFCSQECKDEFIQENIKNAPPPSGPPDEVNRHEYVCKVCGKTFYKYYKSKHIKYCSHECLLIGRYGYRAAKEDTKDDD